MTAKKPDFRIDLSLQSGFEGDLAAALGRVASGMGLGGLQSKAVVLGLAPEDGRIKFNIETHPESVMQQTHEEGVVLGYMRCLEKTLRDMPALEIGVGESRNEYRFTFETPADLALFLNHGVTRKDEKVSVAGVVKE